MSSTKFYSQLILLSVILLLILFGLNQLEDINPYQDIGWISLGFFIGLSVLIFILAKKAAQSDNKHNFTNVVLGFTMLKMLFCAIMILVYNKFYEPTSKMFLVPFFLIYLSYTIFETYVMMKLGKSSK